MTTQTVSDYEIAAPPPDFELGFTRKPLKYVAALPAAGVGERTGVILFLCPWGMHPAEDYCRTVLLPRLAERYDCVAAAPIYFGIGVKSPAADANLQPPNGLIEGIRRMFGDAVAALPPREQFRALAEAGLTELPTQLAFSINPFPEYQSFGLMPALDAIAVLADLLRRHPLRRDRLHCFGSSYGGYIASILLKLMPNTFHVMVENSGFVEAQPFEMANQEFNVFHWLSLQGVRTPIFYTSPWTFKDAASPRFAGPGVMAMRSCLQDAHYAPSKTLMRSYHAAQDKLVPIEGKRAFWAILADRTMLRASTVTPDMVDGRLFKTADHGMDASMLDMMDDALADTPDASADAFTDFDRRTERVLPAGNRTYLFRFAEDLSFHAEVQ
ncbi:MAG TPA: DUF2920 family protein [Stellaceae bacterium]|jgi:pimeloyl-ACP methyl ester carboxylesterase|nr:DUF2920 family protein [Stellaceae bacterium]